VRLASAHRLVGRDAAADRVVGFTGGR
jgi:hypothetical protein